MRSDFLVPEHRERMRPLLGKIAIFAINQIKEQLAFMQTKQGQKAYREDCECPVRWNFNIPCVHLLPPFGPIAPTLVAKRWHLQEAGVFGKAWHKCHIVNVHSTYILQLRVVVC
jgi:hypothetical protein